MIEEIKTVKLSSKRQISIPTSFKALAQGDKAIIKIEKNRIIIEPLKNYNEESRSIPMMLSEEVFAKDWLSEEDEEAFAYLQNEKNEKR